MNNDLHSEFGNLLRPTVMPSGASAHIPLAAHLVEVGHSTSLECKKTNETGMLTGHSSGVSNMSSLETGTNAGMGLLGFFEVGESVKHGSSKTNESVTKQESTQKVVSAAGASTTVTGGNHMGLSSGLFFSGQNNTLTQTSANMDEETRRFEKGNSLILKTNSDVFHQASSNMKGLTAAVSTGANDLKSIKMTEENFGSGSTSNMTIGGLSSTLPNSTFGIGGSGLGIGRSRLLG